MRGFGVRGRRARATSTATATPTSSSARLRLTRRGGVYVYLGGRRPRSAVATPPGPRRGQRLRLAVASAGDVNGDGYGDVVVGATGKLRYIYFGSAAGIRTAPSETLVGPDIGSGFGDAVAGAGDVNGDGYADVVVGAPAYRRLATAAHPHLSRQRRRRPTASGTRRRHIHGADHLSSRSLAADVNGDGYGDLLVGAMGENRFFVYFGGASGLARVPDQTLLGPSGTAGQDFPLPVSAAGDVNGDGYADDHRGAPRAYRARSSISAARPGSARCPLRPR